MNIINYAENVLKLGLSNFQKDLLEVLEVNHDSWLHSIKPLTFEVAQVLAIHKKYKENVLIAV